MAILTNEEKKLLRDPDWRLDNLYKIKDKNQRLINFKKNSIQNTLHQNSTRFDAILKPRQVGISTYYLLRKLDKACFTPNYTVAILSHKRDSMEKLFSIIRRAHKHMHPMIQPTLDKGGGSKYEMRFPAIDSKIYCTMEAVSDTVNDLHISEMALMDRPERVSTSMDAVPLDNGIISIETTPRGLNHFYDFWMDEDSIFKKHFFPWFMQEEYLIDSENLKLTPLERQLKKETKKLFGIDLTNNQIAWRRFKIKQKGDLDEFLQEFPENDATCFLMSGSNFLDLAIIKDLKDEARPAVTDDGLIKIYKPYDKEHIYVCGADTAEGVGGDYSVGTIIDVTTMEQVAQVRGHIKPSDFAHNLDQLCRQYQHGSKPYPLLGVERNNHGHAVLLELDEHINYPNLYKHKDDRPGWVTDRITRPIMLNDFRDGLENRTIKINSHDLLNEALTLINNNGKIEASQGKHDDCIISGSIALQMCIKINQLNFYNDIDRRILV